MPHKKQPEINLGFYSDIAGIGAVLIAGIAYFTLLPGHILGGDNAEFANLLRSGGIAHPPGYPLYTAYLRCFQWLPGNSARVTAFATAIIGTLQIASLYIACRYWNIKPLAASICTAIYASSPLALLYNTQAEVFALNGLLACMALITCAPYSPIQGHRRSIAIALILGLGAAHHHTLVLLAPVLIYGYTRGVQEEKHRGKAILILWSILAFTAGASSYALLPHWSIASEKTASSWATIQTFEDMTHTFLRKDYGTLRLSSGSDERFSINAATHLLKNAKDTWGAIIPLATAGLFLAKKKKPRISLLCICIAILITGPIFTGAAGVEPTQLNSALLERFHLLPLLLATIPCAYGIDLLIRHSTTKHTDAARRHAPENLRLILSLLAPTIIFLLSSARSIGSAEQLKSASIETYLKDSLINIEHNAVIITGGDDQFFGYPYLQESLGIRKDITFISAFRTRSRDNYTMDTLNRLAKININHFSEVSPKGIIDAILQKSVPVYILPVTNPETNQALENYKSIQLGIFRKIIGPEQHLPSAKEEARINAQIFKQYHLQRRQPTLTDGWMSVPAIAQGGAWQNIASSLENEGERALAKQALSISSMIGPCLIGSCDDKTEEITKKLNELEKLIRRSSSDNRTNQ